MESINIEIQRIIKKHLNYNIENWNKNLFDIFPAYELLYLVNPIEEYFGIDVINIISNTDHNVMSINGISEKIAEYYDKRNSNDRRWDSSIYSFYM